MPKAKRIEEGNNRVRLVAESGKLAPWFYDRALLPKDPVPRIVARLRGAS
jgi:hypothetical protein